VHSVRQVLADVERLVDAAATARVEREAHLTVASRMTVSEYLLPERLGKLRRLNPDVSIPLQVSNSMQVFERVTDGSCDLGFVEGPSVPDHLNKTTVARDRLVVK
jgi:DNA-binding transcriptional LysR family regulator